MKSKLLILGLLLALMSSSLWSPQPPEAKAQAEAPLYLALVWHQHQPVYFKDPATGIYERPWVRVHAAKNYLDMVTILDDYPEIHATYNLTPSLMLQLEDFQNGAKDRYWVTAEIPAEQLTEDDKRFLLSRFFDINPRIIARFPRYQELADLRVGGSEEQITAALGTWTSQDYLDLQVLFNLGWTDPDFLAQEPLASLVAKERNFEEADKAIIFEQHLNFISQVIPAHRERQARGQIEVTTTPLAHPILPLLVDSDVAFQAMPEAALPPQFTWGQDAVAQVQMGIEMYEQYFGMPPRGMWPAEGSVSQDIIQMLANNGVEWIATDEAVLGNSLPDFPGFTRNSADTIQQADALYRPYQVSGRRGGGVNIIFRDHLISDKLGFEYSNQGGVEAATDLMARLDNIQAQLAAEGVEGPHLVTILLDGENPWEYYENDGKDFLRSLYEQLSAAEDIQTTTPSEFLDLLADSGQSPRPLESLWAGSWVTPDFSTWIGEEEENLGWTYLLQMRRDVDRYIGRLSAEDQEQVMRLVYFAEGSDWFWWYGADQNSGVDRNFDAQFRGYLEQIYQLLGQPVPDFVYVPIIAQGIQAPDQAATGLLTVTVDGQATDAEWAPAGSYNLAAGSLLSLGYGFDLENLYLRLGSEVAFQSGDSFEVYFRGPDPDPANAYPLNSREEIVGFGARRVLKIDITDAGPTAELLIADGQGGWEAPRGGGGVESIRVAGANLEIALPLSLLSPAGRSGDTLIMRLAANTAEGVVLLPAEGSIAAALPDQPIPNLILQAADPANDDYGPGSYVYPLDPVFRGGAYDLISFAVGYDDSEVVFQAVLRGPLVDDWGSRNGMGILSMDIYVDVDGPANGARLLLPGRNAALSADHAWDYAIFAEGWDSAIYQPAPDGGVTVLTNTAFSISTNPTLRQITVRVPRDLMPGDPTTWAYTATLASQDGFPAAGVLRIRDVEAEATQWRLGGATGNTNATRLLDVLIPDGAAPDQMTALSNYPPSQGDLDSLGPDDFAQLPMLRVE